MLTFKTESSYILELLKSVIFVKTVFRMLHIVAVVISYLMVIVHQNHIMKQLVYLKRPKKILLDTYSKLIETTVVFQTVLAA